MYASVPNAWPGSGSAPGRASRPVSICESGEAASSGSAPPSWGLLGAQHLGESPVHDLDLAEGPHHHVGRLQVPVNDASTVGVSHRLTDLGEDLNVARQVVVGRGAPGEQLGEGAALDQFHDDERLTARADPQFMHRDDARVLELPGDPCLLHEPALQHALRLGGAVARRGQQRLEGDTPMER
jgi:hypothetical protein